MSQGNVSVTRNLLFMFEEIGEIWLLKCFRVITEPIFIRELSLLKRFINCSTCEGGTGIKNKGLIGGIYVR